MMLAVGEALLACDGDFSPAALEDSLRRAFVGWLHSPDNTRAPGNTCLTACVKLDTPLPWHKATVVGSKGCGANMRVQPVGLLRVDPPMRAAIAQFQAALTHGHPTALAASDLTAAAVHALREGMPPDELPSHLRKYARSQRSVYHSEYLGPVWQLPGEISAEHFISRGWDECLTILDRLDAALKESDRQSDPCDFTGAGWIAEEAFGTGLLCFLLFPDNPVAAVRRAAVTSGDSDSIACLAGAFAGSARGIASWPEEWLERIEYRSRLMRLGAAFD